MATGFGRSLFDSRIVIVTGKGGCGKTTVASAIAIGAAESGLNVALVEMGRDEHIHKLLDPTSSPVGYEGRELLPSIWVSHIDPFDSLAEYLSLQIGLRRLIERTLKQPTFQQLLAAAPGWRELVTLGKIWHLEDQRDANGKPRFDLIVADAPATGHGLTFLDVPRVVQSAVRSGPLRRRSGDVESLISDPERTKLIAVCLPEELPVRETAQLIARLRDDLEMAVEAVVVNAMMKRPFRPEHEDIGERLAALPGDLRFGEMPSAAELAQCCEEQLSRYRMNLHYLEEAASVTDSPILSLPQLPDGVRGPEDLRYLSHELFGGNPEDDGDRDLSNGDPS